MSSFAAACPSTLPAERVKIAPTGLLNNLLSSSEIPSKPRTVGTSKLSHTCWSAVTFAFLFLLQVARPTKLTKSHSHVLPAFRWPLSCVFQTWKETLSTHTPGPFPRKRPLAIPNMTIPCTGAANLRASFLRHGQSWEAALEKSLTALRDRKRWSCVLQTEEQSNLIFRSVMRMQASIHDLLKMRFATYPLQLLDLLLDPRDLKKTPEAEEAALQLLTAKTCMLDSFSQHIRASFESPGALLGADCQAILRVVLQTLVGTTFRVETLHSVNLRRLKSRCMTHAISLADVAVTHAGSTAPLIATVLQNTGRDTERSDKKAQGPETRDAKGVKKRRGGGGAWRTYMHLVCAKEGTHQPFQKDVVQRYNALSVEERKHLQLIGRAASMEHQEGRRAFPPTVQAAQKDLQRQRQQQAATSSTQADILSTALVGAAQRRGQAGWKSTLQIKLQT